MIKKLLVLLVFLMIFSCEAIRELEPGPIFPTDDRDSKSGVSSTAFGKDKVVKDILNRPINNRISFYGTTILIPEGTKLNDKKNAFRYNIVDIKTKIGLSIYFQASEVKNPAVKCFETYYCKVVDDNIYRMGIYGGSADEYKIMKKIAEINGFVKGTYR